MDATQRRNLTLGLQRTRGRVNNQNDEGESEAAKNKRLRSNSTVEDIKQADSPPQTIIKLEVVDEESEKTKIPCIKNAPVSASATEPVDRVTLCSVVPLVPAIHRSLAYAVALVPIIDCPSLVPSLMTNQKTTTSPTTVAERNRVDCYLRALRIHPSSEATPLQRIVRCALQQNALALETGLVDTFLLAGGGGGVATVQWSDGSIGCTKDLSGLCDEMRVRMRHLYLEPSGDVEQVVALELGDEEDHHHHLNARRRPNATTTTPAPPPRIQRLLTFSNVMTLTTTLLLRQQQSSEGELGDMSTTVTRDKSEVVSSFTTKTCVKEKNVMANGGDSSSSSPASNACAASSSSSDSLPGCNDAMERRACLLNLARLRFRGTTMGGLFRVKFCRPQERLLLAAPELSIRHARVLHSNETTDSDNTTCILPTATNTPIRRVQSEHEALIDASLVFCVEHPTNPLLTSLCRLSEVVPRIGVDIDTSLVELLSFAMSALATLTTQRLTAMYEIARVERSPQLRVEWAQRTTTQIEWYARSPQPVDVVTAICAMAREEGEAEEEVEGNTNESLWAEACRSALAPWDAELPLLSETSSKRIEVRLIERNGTLSTLSTLKNGVEGSDALHVVNAFLNKHGRTMRAAELKGLLPR